MVDPGRNGSGSVGYALGGVHQLSGSNVDGPSDSTRRVDETLDEVSDDESGIDQAGPFVIRLTADRRYWSDYIVPHWSRFISDACRYTETELPQAIGRAEIYENDSGVDDEWVYLEVAESGERFQIASVRYFDDEIDSARKVRR